MSVKTKHEIRKHVVTEKVLVSEKRYCDECGKEITDHYWYLRTHHSDWGNDSCESFETFDLCSPDCLRKKFEEYVYESNTDMNTKEFEVTHRRSAGVRGEVTYEDHI